MRVALGSNAVTHLFIHEQAVLLHGCSCLVTHSSAKQTQIITVRNLCYYLFYEYTSNIPITELVILSYHMSKSVHLSQRYGHLYKVCRQPHSVYTSRRSVCDTLQPEMYMYMYMYWVYYVIRTVQLFRKYYKKSPPNVLIWVDISQRQVDII